MQTFDLKVAEYGTSIVLVLPRDLREKTGIKPGDFLRLSIKAQNAISMQRMKLVPAEEESAEKKERSPPTGKMPSNLFFGKAEVVPPGVQGDTSGR